MKRNQTSERRYHLRVLQLTPVFIVCLLLGVIFFVVRVILKPTSYRQVVLFMARPVVILSFDSKREKAIALTISEDTVIRGAFGYGEFSMRSLLSLDTIDKKEGNLLRASVSRALGIPVTHVIERNGDILEASISPNSLRQLLSIRHKPASYGWIEWLRFLRTMSTLPADGLRVIDLSSAGLPIQLPDGSHHVKLDETRVDAIMGSELYDADLRNESVTVALYNTTDAPSIGRVIGRQLTRVGIRLVIVGNKSMPVTRCRILGNKTSLHTQTASYLQSTYGCDTVVDSTAGMDVGADVVLELGEEEATRYK